MAKLSARGRKVQVEASREYTPEQLQKAHDRYEASYKADYVPGSDPSLTIWERTTRRLMSDGKVLEKRDVRFRQSAWETEPRYHSYGWKVHGTLKAGLTAADYARIYTAPRKDGSPSTWTIKTAGIIDTPSDNGIHKSLTAKRIERAVRASMSDMGNPGFCLACGTETDGCEPDAREYHCDACGQHKVYGAEEVLMMIA